MSYDLMNRRDTVTAHHTSVKGAAQSAQNYLDIGCPPDKINLGFAFYAKYFTTAGDCSASPLGCPIKPAEDPTTGQDTLTSGAWTFETAHMRGLDKSQITPSMDGTCGPDKMTKCPAGTCCSQYGNCGSTPQHCSGGCQHAFSDSCTDADVFASWQSAAAAPLLDEDQGGAYYYDSANSLFWTWDTPEFISDKFQQIVSEKGLGGVMAWSLGEDSYDWSHIKAIAGDWARFAGGGYGTPNGTEAATTSEEPTYVPTTLVTVTTSNGYAVPTPPYGDADADVATDGTEDPNAVIAQEQGDLTDAANADSNSTSGQFAEQQTQDGGDDAPSGDATDDATTTDTDTTADADAELPTGPEEVTQDDGTPAVQKCKRKQK